MNARIRLLAPLAVVLAMTSAESLADPRTDGALPVPANRLAGLWNTVYATAPCGSPAPGAPQRGTHLVLAGGGFIDNSVYPPSGIPGLMGISGVHKRSMGVGTWKHDGDTNRYSVHLRFDWYVNDAYHGYQTVDRQILLSNNGRTATGPVRSTRYAADGSVIAELCGNAVSTRE